MSPIVVNPIAVSPSAVESPAMDARGLRPLLGASVVVRTTSAIWRGTLLSCVRDSAWFVVDDADVVVPLDDLISVRVA